MRRRRRKRHAKRSVAMRKGARRKPKIRRGRRTWRKRYPKQARRYDAHVQARRTKALREGRLKIVDGYYYRRYSDEPYFSDGVTNRQWRYKNGEMVDQHGRPHDWRREAREHQAWALGG